MVLLKSIKIQCMLVRCISSTPCDIKGSVKQCTGSFRAILHTLSAINLQYFNGHHWGYETTKSILFFIWGYVTYPTTTLQYLEVSSSPASPLPHPSRLSQ